MATRSAEEYAQDLAEWLTKVATSEEHDRLERLLKLLANVAGYKTEAAFESGTRPDVLRTKDADASALLIADAKVAPHDVPSNTETAAQIKGYIASFKKETKYASSVIAIATNSEDAAKEWIVSLASWVREAGLGPGNPSSIRHDAKTWVVIGSIDRSLR